MKTRPLHYSLGIAVLCSFELLSQTQELTPLDCSTEPNQRSVSGDTSTTIRFSNAASFRVSIFWLDYAGKRVQYALLGPGESYVQGTYVTHPWLVTNSSDQCMAIYLPASQASAAPIRDSGPPVAPGPPSGGIKPSITSISALGPAPVSGQRSVLVVKGGNIERGFKASITTAAGTTNVAAAATTYISSQSVAVDVTNTSPPSAPYTATLTIENPDSQKATGTFQVNAPSALVTAGAILPQSILTTVAGGSRVFRGDGDRATNVALGTQSGLALSPDGSAYLSLFENNVVVKISTDGILTVVAGNGIRGFSGDGGPATRASLSFPKGIGLDAAGNLYILDQVGSRVRKVSSDGSITTIAGNGNRSYAGDGGPASAASFGINHWAQSGLAVDKHGNIYIADEDNARVRKIDTNGNITTVAGNGKREFSGDGGRATSAGLDEIEGVAVDLNDNLYITGGLGWLIGRTSKRIRRVTPDGNISTVAGGGNQPVQEGALAVSADFHPRWVAADSQGNLFVSDDYSRFLKIGTDGRIHLFAGRDGGFDGDGKQALDTKFAECEGLAVDTQGSVWIMDGRNFRLRVISPNGVVRTVAGSGLKSPIAARELATGTTVDGDPRIAIDANGNLWWSDEGNHVIRQLTPDGYMRTVAGTGVDGFAGDGGPAAQAQFSRPAGIAVDSNGNVYIADSQNFRIRRISPTGIIQTVVDGLSQVEGVAVDAAGVLYVSNSFGYTILKRTLDGKITTIAGTGDVGFSGDGGPAIRARFNGAYNLAVDAHGNVYVSDTGNFRVRMIDTGGNINTVAGGGNIQRARDGELATNLYVYPLGVFVDAAGILYFVDQISGWVFRVGADRRVTRMVGGGPCPGGDGGAGGAANNACTGSGDVTFDKAGNLYVADWTNGRICKVLATPPSFNVANLPSEVRLSASSKGAPAQTTLLVSSSVSLMAYSSATIAQDDSAGNWLRVNPVEGATPRQIEILADPTNLSPRALPYEGAFTITVSDANPRTQAVKVLLQVGSPLPPNLVLDTSILSFPYPAGAAARSDRITVSNTGSGDLAFQTSIEYVSAESGWLTVSSSSGIAKPAAPVVLNVTGNPRAQRPGTYRARVVITGGGVRKVVAVIMALSRSGQALLLTQKGLSFRAVTGGGIIPPQTFGVTNLGGGSLSWSSNIQYLSSQGWLTVTLGGVSDPLRQVPQAEVNVRHTGLDPCKGPDPCNYYALVEIRGDARTVANTPQVVPVFLELLPAGSNPGSSVDPAELVFTATQGTSPSSNDAFVYNISQAPKTFTVRTSTSSGGDWLSVAPLDGLLDPQKRTRVVVQPTTSGLAPGQYRGTLTFQFAPDGQVREVSVLLIVAAAGTAGKDGPRNADGCDPTTLSPSLRTLGGGFAITAGWPVGLQVEVTDDCGQPMNDGTVVVQFSNGDPPITMTPLRNGRWDGTWATTRNLADVTIVVDANRSSGDKALSGKRTVTGRLSSKQEPPSFTEESIATYSSGKLGQPFARGGVITIKGAGLADNDYGSLGQAQYPSVYPPGASGTKVVIDDTPLALISLKPTEITAQIPFTLSPDINHGLYIRRGALPSRTVNINVASAQPGIVYPGTSTQGDIRYGSNGSGLLADASNRAKSGDTVFLFCVGLGPLDQRVDTGDIVTHAQPIYPLTVTIGGVKAGMTSADYYGGAYFVGVVVPDGIPIGDEVPVVVSVDTGDQVIDSEPATMATRNP